MKCCQYVVSVEVIDLIPVQSTMRHKVKWCSLSLVQHRTTVVFILFSMFPTLLGVYTQEHDVNMPHHE